MKKNTIALITGIMLTTSPVWADNVGFKTALSVGENFSLALNSGTEAVLTWSNGTTENYTFNGSVAKFTVKSDSLTVATSTSITSLIASNDKLVSLNTDGAAKLLQLYCPNNQLSSLSLTKNTVLTDLNCENNSLATLSLTKNTALLSLNCACNKIETIDLGYLAKITTLICANNKLTNLSLSRLTKLQQLWCQDNSLATLDVSHQPLLHGLLAYNNKLTSLPLSVPTDLKNLWAYNNQLADTLDLNAQTALQSISIENNQLTDLLLNKGAKDALKSFYAFGNSLFFNSFPTVYNKSTGKYLLDAILTPQNPYKVLNFASKDVLVSFADIVGTNAWSISLGAQTTVKTADGTALVKNTDYTAVLNRFTFKNVYPALYLEVTSSNYPDMTMTTKSFPVIEGTDGIESVTDAGLSVSTGVGQLTVTTSKPVMVKLANGMGMGYTLGKVSGSRTFYVPAGIYIINGIKVAVR